MKAKGWCWGFSGSRPSHVPLWRLGGKDQNRSGSESIQAPPRPKITAVISSFEREMRTGRLWRYVSRQSHECRRSDSPWERGSTKIQPGSVSGWVSADCGFCGGPAGSRTHTHTHTPPQSSNPTQSSAPRSRVKCCPGTKHKPVCAPV